MFHRIEGEGPITLLLVHGSMCDNGAWNRMTPLLSERFRVVRCDLRGHGRTPGSPADCSIEGWGSDVNELAERLDGLVVLVGHSLGARIVAQAAASGSRDYAGVVLVDGSRIQNAATPRPEPGEAIRREISFDRQVGPYADAEAREAIKASFDWNARPIFEGQALGLVNWDDERADAVYRGLAGRSPVLVIQSTYQDRVTPRRSLESADERTPYLDYLAEAVPEVEIAIVTHAGHFNIIEKPAEVAGLIAEFAQRVAGG